jgi:hypothetical protein
MDQVGPAGSSQIRSKQVKTAADRPAAELPIDGGGFVYGYLFFHAIQIAI